jgi:hypothetical protein
MGGTVGLRNLLEAVKKRQISCSFQELYPDSLTVQPMSIQMLLIEMNNPFLTLFVQIRHDIYLTRINCLIKRGSSCVIIWMNKLIVFDKKCMQYFNTPSVIPAAEP